MKILVFMLVAIPLLIQNDKEFIPCRDEAAFRKQYLRTANQINTLKAKFVQEKSLSILTGKLVSSGEFYYKREAMVRMEYFKPVSWLFIMNSKKVYIRSQDKEMNIPAGSSKLFSQISSITMGVVNGDILAGKDFASRILENNNQFLLKLTPKNRDIKLLFSEFNVYINKNDYMVDRIIMSENSGDKTTINFSEKEVNIHLNDALFSIH